jgi:hypothetical protein
MGQQKVNSAEPRFATSAEFGLAESLARPAPLVRA